MTTYVYHIPRDEQGMKMANALREFLGVDLAVTECLELTTGRSAVATVVESLFNVTPELRYSDYMDEIVDDRLADLAAGAAPVVEAEHQESEAVLVACPFCHSLISDAQYEQHTSACPQMPTFEETQAEMAAEEPVLLGMRQCPECGEYFDPAKPNQTYCTKKCASRVYNRTYQAKKAAANGNGNGHQPAQVVEQAPIAVAEPPAQPEPDPIVDLINADVIAADVIGHQTLRWLIASSGKEVESVTDLIARGKLTPGERLHHKTKGWWEVFLNDMGVPDLRKVKEGAE